jgi:hypothetical protein
MPVAARTHAPPEPKVPAQLAPKPTEPVGGLTGPSPLSDTVAVHVDGAPMATLLGEQESEVVVVRVGEREGKFTPLVVAPVVSSSPPPPVPSRLAYETRSFP